MTRERQHLRSLTSLRFFAAALIVIYHADSWSAADQSHVLVLRLGFLGVTFFFVLSGFVLVWSASPGDTAIRFYRRRFARVYPVHALTLIVAVGLGVFGLVSGGVHAGLLNAILLQAWSSDLSVVYGYNGVSWSLSNEAFFYACFPLAYLVVRLLGARLTIAGGFFGVVAGGLAAELVNREWIAYSFPPFRLGEFVLGMGLALLVREGIRVRIPVPAAVALLTVSYITLVAADSYGGGELVERMWPVALGVLPAVAVVVVSYAQLDLDGAEGWLTRPALVRLGQWSFALYMVHELVFRIARPVMLEQRWSLVIFVLVSVAISGAVYEWFERPLEKRLRGSHSPAAQLASAGTR